MRDPQEAALGLPRTYGVDDLPLAVTSRRFLTSNQFSYDHIVDNYGDSMLVNGTLTPQVSLPKQWVRLRILNAEVARGYNLGFSDNRTFYIIANDAGLLSVPVAVTRMKLMTGERVEILVNLGGRIKGRTNNPPLFSERRWFLKSEIWFSSPANTSRRRRTSHSSGFIGMSGGSSPSTSKRTRGAQTTAMN